MFTIAIHGGAESLTPDALSPEQQRTYLDGLETALQAGYDVLAGGGTALDAVEQAVRALEDNALFNAGRGAVFTDEHTHQFDAALMCGATQRAGAVAGVSGIRNPIALARAVMEHTEHVLLAGQGAEAFARQQDVAFAPDDYFFSQQRHDEWADAREQATTERRKDTVGAVALDRHGNVAAATSTGGLAFQRAGRVGDSPCIGAGTYAHNDICAVSCTGDGEVFLRAVAAHKVACLVEYKGLALQEAADHVIGELIPHLGGEGGLVALDRSGRAVLVFNTSAMFRGWRNHRGEGETAIFKS